MKGSPESGCSCQDPETCKITSLMFSTGRSKTVLRTSKCLFKNRVFRGHKILYTWSTKKLAKIKMLPTKKTCKTLSKAPRKNFASRGMLKKRADYRETTPPPNYFTISQPTF
jgi:hypothetical protein